MSLYRRLVSAIIVLLLAFSTGVFVIEVQQTRASLETQQRNQVTNLTQALSLSLVPFVEVGDWVAAETLIHAAFDGAAVKRIQLDAVGRDQPLVVERTAPAHSPELFQSLVRLPEQEGQRDVGGGWSPLGTLYVEADNNPAYNELWQLAIKLFGFLTLSVLIAVVVCTALIRWLLKPLKTLSQHVSDMEIHGFNKPLKPTRIKELEGITHAVNRLGKRLKEQYDAQSEQVRRLQAMAERDAVSELGNRAYLGRVMDEWLAAPDGGSLMIVQFDALDDIYRRNGFEARDTAIRALAHQLRAARLNGETLSAARLSANEFAAILPDADDDERYQFIEQLLATLDRALDVNPMADEQGARCHAGVVVKEPGAKRMTMLAAADKALQIARERQLNWELAPRASALDERNRGEWKLMVDQAIDEDRFLFVAQPVLTRDGNEFHREIFLRLPEGERVHSAGSFVPVVYHFRMGDRLDRYVFEWIAKRYESLPERLAVNLTADTLGNSHSLDQLCQWFEKHPEVTARLDVEVSESDLLKHPSAIQRLSDHLRPLGARLGIDRFARNLQVMPYLVSLRPGYVKIDQSFFVRDDVDTELLRSLCMAAHQVDALVVVTRVETEEQRKRVEAIGADGFQGFLAPIEELVATRQ
ncbi:EAL domain-containing protein [Larsenimonas suaedae]|uniref:EAL domain-containing protein n=1 Tax=Larsenimonas suaedae TaxID=1851019 RepID=A0ABU1GWA6_9GAMM|nr:EAL domain-containing protein [Larsenimonas suaedae]MCM2972050.1 EAL domain-containing protein [Larsenimonas suaedae]MDR5895603.1 EAL domain-containing protein [Larsenimonas suaedae]